MKRTLFILFLLNTECWKLNTVSAKDLGVDGTLYPIKEKDPILMIQQKLKMMEETGELKKKQQELQQKTKTSVERPKPVPGITKATEQRVFTYDPTYVVQQDIRDHLGRILHRKGTKINPLETVSLSHNLVFFDGDDPDQKTWAFDRIKRSVISNQNEKKVRLILVKGAPLALSEELNAPVYFDQGGLLTKQLGIKHVPALVCQEAQHLRIEEIPLKGNEKEESL